MTLTEIEQKWHDSQSIIHARIHAWRNSLPEDEMRAASGTIFLHAYDTFDNTRKMKFSSWLHRVMEQKFTDMRRGRDVLDKYFTPMEENDTYVAKPIQVHESMKTRIHELSEDAQSIVCAILEGAEDIWRMAGNREKLARMYARKHLRMNRITYYQQNKHWNEIQRWLGDEK